jgi:hypothetical protein
MVMEQENMWTTGIPQSGLLNNSGGPRSRTRTEDIRQSILKGGGGAHFTEAHHLDLPKEVTDPEAWLFEIAKREGYRDWDLLASNLRLPRMKLLVVELNGDAPIDLRPMEILRTAFILAHTNGQRYLPEGPRIFTRSRLCRGIRLVDINLDAYYEMD